jgi:uncharacterized membrane protein
MDGLYPLMKILHLLSAVVWVGGMFFAYLVLRPSMSVLEPPQRMALHGQVFRRFFLVIWHAMPLIILTGFIMLFGVFGGMAGAPWNVHLMLLIGVIMAGIFMAIFFGPYRRFRAAPDAASLNSIRKLIGVNLVLGLFVTVIAVLV